MSYGNSKKWIAPGVREKQRHQKLNQARAKICKDSPFWPLNFNLEAHKREFSALQQARLALSDTSSSASSGESPHILPQMGDLPSTPTNPRRQVSSRLLSRLRLDLLAQRSAASSAPTRPIHRPRSTPIFPLSSACPQSLHPTTGLASSSSHLGHPCTR
jgi:hypothetical protein